MRRAYRDRDSSPNRGGVWDRFDLAGLHPEPPELTTLRDHDRAAVPCPAVARDHLHVTNRVALRGVAFDRVHNEPLGAGHEIAQPERRAYPVAMAAILD